MFLTIHTPRPYEAEIKPQLKQDLEIRPRFYRKQGWFPLLPITIVNAKGRERRYMISVSATSGALMMQEMKEVAPDADTKGKTVDSDEDIDDREEEQESENESTPTEGDKLSVQVERALAAAEQGQAS
jgi:hypothetical protein